MPGQRLATSSIRPKPQRRNSLALHRVWSLGRPMRIQGHSMMPLLRDGDLVLVDRSAYRDRGPQRGEIVAARPAWLGGRACVKRVAGAPHETITDVAGTRRVAADQYLLVGENLHESVDSRTLGPVTGAELIGRVWLRLWPPMRLNQRLSKRSGWSEAVVAGVEGSVLSATPCDGEAGSAPTIVSRGPGRIS